MDSNPFCRPRLKAKTDAYATGYLAAISTVSLRPESLHVEVAGPLSDEQLMRDTTFIV